MARAGAARSARQARRLHRLSPLLLQALFGGRPRALDEGQLPRFRPRKRPETARSAMPEDDEPAMRSPSTYEPLSAPGPWQSWQLCLFLLSACSSGNGPSAAQTFDPTGARLRGFRAAALARLQPQGGQNRSCRPVWRRRERRSRSRLTAIPGDRAACGRTLPSRSKCACPTGGKCCRRNWSAATRPAIWRC